ncbi:MAG TPA: CPBP family glutamic-type intramembrane protease [bacterium]|nr:CPBP family glutamic-type intramembrane protease [bacterium]
MKTDSYQKKIIAIAIILTVAVTAFALWMNTTKFEFRYYVFPAVLIFLPLVFNSSFRPQNILKPSKKGFKLFFYVTLAVLFLYPPAFFIYWITLKNQVFMTPGTEEVLKAVLKGLTAVAVAAIPEEFFFRGYLQEHVFKGLERKFIKVVTLKNLITSILFGVVHAVAFLDITRAATFFPSLLFGLFCEKSEGKIFYSILFHVISNILAFVLWTFIK